MQMVQMKPMEKRVKQEPLDEDLEVIPEGADEDDEEEGEAVVTPSGPTTATCRARRQHCLR